MKYAAPNFQPPSTGRNIRPYLLAGAIVIAITGVVIGSRLWYTRSLNPVNTADTNFVEFKIPEGATSEQIARSLEDAQLIRNQLAFRLYLRFQGVSGDIQAGVYQFSPALSASELTRKLISGEIAARLITITPGMRIDQVVNRLRQEQFSEADISAALTDSYPYSILADKPAENGLEGYLYPDTYRLDLDTSVAKLIDLILYNTDQKVTTAIRQGWAKQGLDLHQGITLSSIVISEVANAQDQRQVAQVFLKRLAISKKLESDVTFIYGAELLGAEATTALDSPYNTYLHQGLPPGPIANPDLQAMEAVANPATTNFLYFLSDRAGNTHFTDSEAKHKQNVEEFLQ